MSRLCFRVDMDEMTAGISVNVVGVHPVVWHDHPIEPKYGSFDLYDSDLIKIAELIINESVDPTEAVEHVFNRITAEDLNTCTCDVCRAGGECIDREVR